MMHANFVKCWFFVSGAEGKVDESLTAMAEVEELKNQKRMAEVRNLVVANLIWLLLVSRNICRILNRFIKF